MEDILCRGTTIKLTQPVFMTYLSSIGRTVNGAAATVEVGYLTLVLSSNELSSERQADRLPTLGNVNIAVRYTLIPHARSIIEVVSDRTEEVALVNQQVVVGSSEVALYQMAVNGRCRGSSNLTIFIVSVVRSVNRIDEVVCQYLKRLCIDLGRRSVNQQVRCLTLVSNAQQTVITVKQR